MSSVESTKGHRHTQSAAIPSALSLPQNPQNPHHLNLQAHHQHLRSEIRFSSEPTTPPRTPRRDHEHQSSLQNNVSSIMRDNVSKQKSRGKNRPKNVMTSPAMTRDDRNTPPLRSAQSAGIASSARPVVTPSSTAYAGSTFHASPAPSALPIPSFYSKSVPESPGVTGIRAVKDSPVPRDSPTPRAAALPDARPQREESPLDIFFRADREEKERARSASSTNPLVSSLGPFRPPSQSPQMSQTPPAPNSQKRVRHSNKVSGSGMFSMELDGPNPGEPYGPSFSTPYSERIQAARSNATPSSLDQQSQNPQASLDRSAALKAYLFSGQPLQAERFVEPPIAPASAPPLAPTISNGYQKTAPGPVRPIGAASSFHRAPSNDYGLGNDYSGNASRNSGRASGLRQEVTPTKTPTRTPDRISPYSNSPFLSRIGGSSSPSVANVITGRVNPHIAIPPKTAPSDLSRSRNTDLQGMEDSLRKILKLDSTGESGVTRPLLGRVPGAAKSVPNYVGGRGPPLNGIHEGVMGS